MSSSMKSVFASPSCGLMCKDANSGTVDLMPRISTTSFSLRASSLSYVCQHMGRQYRFSSTAFGKQTHEGYFMGLQTREFAGYGMTGWLPGHCNVPSIADVSIAQRSHTVDGEGRTKTMQSPSCALSLLGAFVVRLLANAAPVAEGSSTLKAFLLPGPSVSIATASTVSSLSLF